jgi:GDP-L-fucose synthase
LAKEKGEKFVVRGTGKPLRQFIYATDLAKLIMRILETYNEKESIILSVGENDEMSIGNVATLIAREFDYEYMMVFDDSFSDGQYKKTADNSKLMSLYGDFEFTSMNEGMKKSVQWFIEHFDECRK